MLNKLYLINKDCYVEEDIPNTDTSNETVLYYGQYIGNEVIMYIQSTPLPLYDTLPNDFSFTINGYHQDYAQPINIYRTTQDWVDTITWNDVQPTYASTPYGSITTGSAGWQSYDLTQHGYDWLTGTEINYGLRYSHPTTSTYGSFLSSEYAAKYLRPYFLINGTFGTEDTSELITSDTYLDPNNTTTNYSTAETLTFGNDSTYDDYRTLIQIDNDYVETISTLYQCRLYLYVTAETVETTTGVGYHVVVNSVDASWTLGTVTYANKPASGNRSCECYLGTHTGQINPVVGEWISIDITEQVQAWLDGSTNYGIELTIDSDDNPDNITVASSSNETTANRPYIYVDADFSSGETVEPPTITASTTSPVPVVLGKAKIISEAITSIGTFETPNTLINLLSESMIGEVVASTPTVTASGIISSVSFINSGEVGVPTISTASIISSESMIGNSIASTPIITSSVLIESSSMTNIGTFGVPDLISGVSIQLESMIGNSIASTPIVKASSLLESASMISSSVASTPIILSGISLETMQGISTFEIPLVLASGLINSESATPTGTFSIPIVKASSLIGLETMISYSTMEVPLISGSALVSATPLSADTIVGIPTISSTVFIEAEEMIGNAIASTPTIDVSVSDITYMIVSSREGSNPPYISLTRSPDINTSVESITAISDFGIPNMLLTLPATPCDSIAIMGIPNIVSTINVESMTANSLSATPTLYAGVNIESLSMIGISTFGIPSLEFYTNIFAEPIVGNAISATPIIYAKSLIQLPSMVSNGIMRVHKVLSGEIFLYPELMTAIGTVLPYSKINFSVNMELMTANGIMELPTLYSGDKFVLAESIVVSTKMLCDGAIPMKDIYKKYISGYTTKIKRQVLTPAKLANKNYGSGNNF